MVFRAWLDHRTEQSLENPTASKQPTRPAKAVSTVVSASSSSLALVVQLSASTSRVGERLTARSCALLQTPQLPTCVRTASRFAAFGFFFDFFLVVLNGAGSSRMLYRLRSPSDFPFLERLYSKTHRTGPFAISPLPSSPTAFVFVSVPPPLPAVVTPEQRVWLSTEATAGKGLHPAGSSRNTDASSTSNPAKNTSELPLRYANCLFPTPGQALQRPGSSGMQ
ncbi:unnamed protein product [Pseudo-nitzschia multistriata]|uniref:Uncharacterized protein n=1 Tax=Pseudo-nitzschia multistriata TaxID=183589 RepID=A0A448YW97_9STRA|nr:unnamed protein product [Pseudo-nitzschia multistriata]